MAESKKPTKTKAPAQRASARKKKTTGSILTQAVRRVTTRKPPKAAAEEAPLTAEELAQFCQTLLEKRRQLLGDVDHMQDEALNHGGQNGSGNLSSMPIHMADIGTDNYEQEFTLGLIESERQLLRQMDHALNKLEKGTYGVCEATGQQINRARLEAKPEARYSIEYARKIEQGEAQPLPLDIDDNLARDTAEMA